MLDDKDQTDKTLHNYTMSNLENHALVFSFLCASHFKPCHHLLGSV